MQVQSDPATEAKSIWDHSFSSLSFPGREATADVNLWSQRGSARRKEAHSRSQHSERIGFSVTRGSASWLTGVLSQQSPRSGQGRPWNPGGSGMGVALLGFVALLRQNLINQSFTVSDAKINNNGY